ncbi:SLATT domain-containing protein [Aeromonas veronii]
MFQETLKARIWWTSRARMQTEKRLLSNNFQAQIVLLYYSFFSTCIAIYYLKFDSANDLANVSWLSFSILTMIASIFISTLRYKERADSVKQCYESLTSIYSRIHQDTTLSELYTFEDKYIHTCSLCENHSSSDYGAAIISEYLRNDENGRQQLSKKPTCQLWIESIKNKTKRLVLLLVIYSLPILVLVLPSYIAPSTQAYKIELPSLHYVR